MSGVGGRPGPDDLSSWADPQGGPIAFAGDWHGNTLWALDVIDSLARQGVHVVVHCGDLGIWPGRSGETYLRAVNRQLARHDMKLGVVPGNHDDWDYLDTVPAFAPVNRGVWPLESPRVFHLARCARWQWQGVRFAALGGAISVDRDRRRQGVDWWPQERATYADVYNLSVRGPVDVLVCHDRPSGAPLPVLELTRHLWPPNLIEASDQHQRLIQAAVDEVRPSVVVHGHYHDLPDYEGVDEVHQMTHGPVRVVGLDRDGTTTRRNTWVVHLDELRGSRHVQS